MIDRQNKLNDFYREEFPSLVEDYYNEYSVKYPNRYIPLGQTDDKKNLFDEIEKYIQSEYDVPFKLNKHFNFHSERVFFSPTDNFGITSYINNCDDLCSTFPEYKRGKYYYSIFDEVYPNKKVSKIIQEKLKLDFNLEIQIIKNELRSYFKRFFILGGYDIFWITIDKLNHFGIDLFPDCLNNKLKNINYDIDFGLKLNGIGESSDEFGITVHNRIQKIQDKKEREYLLFLKEKGIENINYKDLLIDPSITKGFNHRQLGFVINSNCQSIGKVPILKINNNIFKQYRSQEFRNQVSKLQEKSNSFCYLNYNDIEFNPFYKQFDFLLEPDDVIEDHLLLSEYMHTYNEPENNIRALLNLPKIGEGWISETNLYYEIKNHFHNEVVLQHGKPKWLGKQHVDIYLPKHNIAIEYQGDQHYFPIDFFGGEDSFKKNKMRDETKRILCKENSCHLIYVNPNYQISNIIDEIENKLNSK